MLHNNVYHVSSSILNTGILPIVCKESPDVSIRPIY